MGNTYRKQSTKFDDDYRKDKGGKHHKHSNNRKSGGMRILNDYQEEDIDDYFDEEVQTSDTISINRIEG